MPYELVSVQIAAGHESMDDYEELDIVLDERLIQFLLVVVVYPLIEICAASRREPEGLSPSIVLSLVGVGICYYIVRVAVLLDESVGFDQVCNGLGCWEPPH